MNTPTIEYLETIAITLDEARDFNNRESAALAWYYNHRKDFKEWELAATETFISARAIQEMIDEGRFLYAPTRFEYGELVKSLKILPGEGKLRAIVRTVAEVVAQKHECEYALIFSKSRHQKVCDARHTAIYLAMCYANVSQKTLAKEFNRDDHTVVNHATNCVNDFLSDTLLFKETHAAVKISLVENNLIEV